LVEPCLPELVLRGHPRLGWSERLGDQLTGTHPTGLGRLHHPTSAQQIEGLHERRQSHVEGRGQLAGGCDATPEPLDDRPSCGIGRRQKQRIKIFGRTWHGMTGRVPEHLGQDLGENVPDLDQKPTKSVIPP